jgi:hypothetical protein
VNLLVSANESESTLNLDRISQLQCSSEVIENGNVQKPSSTEEYRELVKSIFALSESEIAEQQRKIQNAGEHKV